MEFFVLECPMTSETRFATDYLIAKPERIGEAPRCPLCGSYGGGIPWLPPHRAELDVWGEDYGDIAFGPGRELLVSEHFKSAWGESKLTGLRGFWPVELVKVKTRKRLKKPPPKYYCVAIDRSRAALDIVASEAELDSETGVDVCPECRGKVPKRAKRIVFEPNSWTGEDIFFARGLGGYLLCSLRFRDFCNKNAIKNLVLKPALTYEICSYPWEKE